ncbi:hypothetical protein DPMN_108010, partial [Dreissena polymorpha]
TYSVKYRGTYRDTVLPYHDIPRCIKDQHLKSLKCGNRILKAFANSLDPDETPQNVASHQDPN